MVQELSNFEEQVQRASGLVLLDFYADWCGPCKQMVPTLESISKENSYIKIYKVNTDKDSSLAAKNQVRALPTFILFKDGQSIDRRVGFLQKKELQDWIEENK